MKIYTKTGDRGETGLFGGGRVRKDSVRVEAYGEVDELNAAIGAARAARLANDNEALAARIQAELFTVGAVLAAPAEAKAAKHVPQVHDDWIQALEQAIDRIDGVVPSLTKFILPGGTPASSALHLARAVCRRAERRVVALAAHDAVPEKVVVYLNRLSDLLFMMARHENYAAGHAETVWDPPK
jgi:cob(I)alamin adenosyltransferase